MEPEESLPLPEVIDGKYRVVRQLGQGGMGAVYEARHVGTGRRVAVKVIAGEGLSKKPEIVARFQREARATGAIETAHITQVLDTGTDAATGNPYMVMEYLSGEDVQQALTRVGTLSPDLALRILAQACIGLQKAHDTGVVHRDLKPANLFLARGDSGNILVKLLDFGIAKVRSDDVLSAESAKLTRTGSMLGSPLYMSPEQATGIKTADHRSDLWSLGIVLYEMLAGATPYGEQDTLGGLILAICSRPARQVQELAPWVPPEIAAVVHKVLSHDPNDRFQSAAELGRAVEALLPAGSALHEASVVPLSAELRATAAPRLSATFGSSTGPVVLSPVSVAGGTSSGDRPPASLVGGAASSMALPPGSLGGIQAGTNPGLTAAGVADPPAAPARSSRALHALALLGVVVLGGGVAAYRSFATPPAPAIAASPPPASPPPAPASIAVTLAPKPRSVDVAISPANATVEVDGTATPVDNGIVHLSGTLGSMHTLRLSLDGRETTGQVIIAETGPSPARLALDATAPTGTTKAGPKPGGTAASSGATAQPASAATTPPAAAAPVKPPTAPGLDRDFH